MVRFISLDIFVTGVRSLECAFSVRLSSLDHGRLTRRLIFFAMYISLGQGRSRNRVSVQPPNARQVQ
jgi:hypothetical protein